MRKIRWGVLSTANIGMEKVIPAMQRGQHSDVLAIASRDDSTARAAASRLGIPRAYGSYDELLADPEIDAVYIPLPNHLHVPWSIRTLAAGKHVLCEKPIGLTTAEAQRLAEAAGEQPELKVMEAFMYRHHPQWRRIRELLGSGAIGEACAVHSYFSYHNVDPENIRNVAEIGGGGLLDIGCYCISVSRFIFDAEPRRVSGSIDYDEQFGTDRLTSGILDFYGRTSTFTCSTQLAPHQSVTIVGTQGRVEVDLPFTPAPDHRCRLELHVDGRVEEIMIDSADHYTVQGDLFSLAILNDTDPPTTLDDAVANMRVIEAVAESARTRAWIELGPA